MRKSVQLLSTFLIIFIILSLGMMADAKKQCPYKIPINKMFLYCAATHCLADCKKQHGADAMVVVPKKRDFVTALLIVRVLAKCCEYNNIQPKFYTKFLLINI
uniref:Bifunctional inhibitor/plant lipid transfer protein/seed storage helical domain-containing protein n=1 Tax=Brassica oleracea var. oleracea TaxID=109376 RepID=A0A0D3BE37_BRAOL